MKKTLIAYFTRTGITKKLAEDTAKQIGADLFAIEPVKEYSSSYLVCVGQAKIENLQNARPAIKAKPQNLQDYDTIVVMFPIWWFTYPHLPGGNRPERQNNYPCLHLRQQRQGQQRKGYDGSLQGRSI